VKSFQFDFYWFLASRAFSRSNLLSAHVLVVAVAVASSSAAQKRKRKNGFSSKARFQADGRRSNSIQSAE